MGKEFHAFVSYSSHDREWVEVFVRNLKSCGVRVWWDRGEIRPGESWVGMIDEGLGRSDRALLIVSPASMASRRVKQEWHAIIAMFENYSNEGRLIPVMLRWAPVYPLLASLQYQVLPDGDPAKYEEGLRKLAAHLLGKNSAVELECSGTIEQPPDNRHVSAKELWQFGVKLFSQICDRKSSRNSLVATIRKQYPLLEENILGNFPTYDLTASAFLHHANADNPERMKAVVEEYDEDLRAIDEPLFNALLEKLDKALLGDQAPPKNTTPLIKFLDALESDCNRDLLGPLFPEADARLLDELYVKLETEHRKVGKLIGSAKRKEATMGKESMLSCDGLIQDKRPLRKFLASGLSRCWTLQGDPGSGKTTLLLHLAYTLCREAKAALEDKDRPPVKYLPVFIPINDWHKNRKDDEWEYLRDYFSGRSVGDIRATLSSKVATGRIFWLLDGFDEVDSDDVDIVSRKIRHLAERVAPCPVVMTSRRFGYRKPGEEFAELKLLPLSSDAQKSLLERFLEENHAQRVLDCVNQHQSMQDLLCNPFFLTMIGLLASQSKEEGLFETPLRRSHLLGEVEHLLLKGKPGKQRTPIPDLAISREVLDTLSLKLLSDGGGPYSAERISKLLMTDKQAGQLRREWPGGGVDTNKWLTEVANRTGLLLPQGRNLDRWRYLHRSIQEHMAARSLARLGRDQWEPLATSLKVRDKEKAGEDRSHLGQWAETFAYLAGEVSDPNSLLKDLMEVNADLGLRALATADSVKGETLKELLKLTTGGNNWEKRKEVIESIPERMGATEASVRLLAKIRRETTHGADLYFISKAYREIAEKSDEPEIEGFAIEHDRNLFKETLSQLSNDNLDEIVAALQKVPIGGKEVDLWCEIPAGKFQMGSPKKEKGRNDNEPTNHRVTLSSFEMSAVPVTNEMYEYFDPSHEADRAFKDMIQEDERIEDHPVVNVTWYEAVMFCRWATEVLRRHGFLKAGQEIRLPSESEWEYACRAGTSTRFSSGDIEEDLAEVGWYDENSGNRTHPVAKKPANAWGLHDVHGNVWEKCEDTWHDDLSGGPIDGSAWVDSGADGRVFRGGSWIHDADYCRSAYRYWIWPGIRSWHLGFRLAFSSLPLDT